MKAHEWRVSRFTEVSVRRAYFNNAVSGAVQFILSSALLVITIPIFIRMMGAEGYGIFSLLSVFGNLSVLSTLGLNTSLIKHLAEQGRREESDYDIVVSFLLLAFLNSAVLGAGFLFSTEILHKVLNVPPNLIESVRPLYYLLLISNALLVLGQVFSATLDALEKIYITNFVQLVYSTLYWALMLGALLIRPNYGSLGWAAFLSALTWFCIIAYLALRTWGYPTLRGLKREFKRILKKHLGYGMQVYLSGLVGFFYEPLTKLLLSHFIGVAEVGFFDIALRIRNQVWGLVGKMFYPLFPLLAKIADRNKLGFLVHDIEQKTFLVIIPLATMVVFTATPIVHVWIGHNVTPISLTVILVLSAYLLFSTTVLPNYQYLMLKGHASKTIVLQSINATVNAFVFLVTYRHFGYYAAVAGGVVAIISSFVLSLYYQNKFLNSMIFDSIDELRKAVLLLVACFAAGFAAHAIISSQWVRIMMVPVTIVVTSVVMYRFFNVFSQEDIQRYAGANNMMAAWATKVLLRPRVSMKKAF
jgi:O-antigen/teichoic acid export membrane protein